MSLINNNKSLPFWLFTFSVITILIVSQLIQDGMFMDGLFYTCVGKNLADGLGTFWTPHLSKTYMNSFCAQPPLYFGLLALFYKILGNSMYVERIFCFVFFTGTAIYIHKIWKKLFSNKIDVAKLSWLPILFWVTIPICFWAYTNHVEEVVMSFFTIASVYHIFIALRNEENIIFNLIVAGIFIFLSSLTKGAQGLFPVIGAGAYWILTKKISFKKMLLYSLILISIPAIIYLILLITDKDVYTFYYNYFHFRYVRAFSNADNTTGNRFEIIIQLFMVLLPIILLTGLTILFTRNKKQEESEKTNNKIVIWFLLIGLSGSLPLMVTLEQRNFYLLTCLPYFAIAIAIVFASKFVGFTNRININSNKFKISTIICALLFATTLIYTATKYGKCKRDEDAISDVYEIGKIIPHGAVVDIPVAMNEDWSSRYYLLRYFYINLDDEQRGNKYFLIRKNLPENLVPNNYKSYPLRTKFFDLYISKD